MGVTVVSTEELEQVYREQDGSVPYRVAGHIAIQAFFNGGFGRAGYWRHDSFTRDLDRLIKHGRFDSAKVLFRREIITILAGPMAQDKASGGIGEDIANVPSWLDCWYAESFDLSDVHSDYSKIQKLARTVYPSPRRASNSVLTAARWTFEIINDPQTWALIEAIAEELNRSRLVDITSYRALTTGYQDYSKSPLWRKRFHKL